VRELLDRLLAPSPADRPESAIAVHGILGTLAKPSEQRSLQTLLAHGESGNVEFKGSLLQLLEPDPLKPEENQKKAIQKTITKTVAAFLNTRGGSLVIGVNDRGEVVGIEHDFPLLTKKPDRDGWELALKTLLTNALGGDALRGVSFRYEKMDDKTVAIVDVERRTCETWLTEGKSEEFYVRLANSSEQLVGRELLAYIRETW
jgi:predicted HTH transcriptional regulator